MLDSLRGTSRRCEKQLTRQVARLFQALVREIEVTVRHRELTQLLPLGLIRTFRLNNLSRDVKLTQLNGELKFKVGICGDAQRVAHQTARLQEARDRVVLLHRDRLKNFFGCF